MTYFFLFLEFFKTGLFALGGGLATLPFLMELTNRYTWFTAEELTNIIAISESTPGPLGINMATYAGYHAAGFLGALTATASLVLPSVIIIVLIAKFLANFSENKTVRAVFYGIRPAVTALICSAIYGLLKTCLLIPGAGFAINWKVLILTVLLFIVMKIKRFSSFHPAIWLLIAAVCGILFKM